MKKFLLILITITILIIPFILISNSFAKIAYILPIRGTIERGLIPPVKRIVSKAEKANADVLIVEIETFGGDLQSMVEIRDILIETDLQTIAFINKRAISAGALIALACKEIVISPGGTIGAATPVYFDSEGMKEANEKVISYARTEFKSTAEKNAHPSQIAEAMVDKDIEIPDPNNPNKFIIEKGKLLTLTADKAVQVGLATHQAKNIEELKEIYGLQEAKIITLKPNWSERLARFITSSAISGLLLTIGIIALFMEFRTPTWGIAGTTGVICLILFFFGYYIYGLAELMDILLFAIGVALLGLEMFVIPGFGIAGFTGLVLVFGSFVMAIVKYNPESPFFVPNLTSASAIVATSLVASLVLIIILAKFLPRTKTFSKLVLDTNLSMEKSVITPNPISKQDIIFSEECLRRINYIGKMTLMKILHSPNILTFMREAKEFTFNAGFVTPRLNDAISTVEVIKDKLIGYAQNMIGEALHIVLYDKNVREVTSFLKKKLDSATIFSSKIYPSGPKVIW